MSDRSSSNSSHVDVLLWWPIVEQLHMTWNVLDVASCYTCSLIGTAGVLSQLKHNMNKRLAFSNAETSRDCKKLRVHNKLRELCRCDVRIGHLWRKLGSLGRGHCIPARSALEERERTTSLTKKGWKKSRRTMPSLRNFSLFENFQFASFAISSNLCAVFSVAKVLCELVSIAFGGGGNPGYEDQGERAVSFCSSNWKSRVSWCVA